jgi:hypothetical protein
MARATAADLMNKFGIGRQLAGSIVAVSRRVQIADPMWLAVVINFESNGFNPGAVNPTSGASGLIQFMPKTAEELGTTVQKIRKMSAIEQMQLVQRYYLLPRIRKYAPFLNQQDTAMAVFEPRLIGKPPNHPAPSWVTKYNPNVHTILDYLQPMYRRAGIRGPISTPSGGVPGAIVAGGAAAGAGGATLLMAGLGLAALAFLASRR